ncbi:MAG: helix-turn-helix domain-containing protein [Sphaerobacter sp.]|nr:helix-turn-helix domain-containing protein [Sphaerobacter sp.]
MRPIPDITLRDLCRWDRRLSLVPPAGIDRALALDRAVSWAVSVRAAPPLLPPLRGDELVVLSPRVLAQIEAEGTLSREALLAELAQHRIAAILTAPEIAEERHAQLPLLTFPSPFPADAEGMLNRLITERRAELYRLGTDLSRRLSQAAMDPRGVEALLATAAELANRPLVLQDREGNVVGWGGGTLIPPATAEELALARSAIGPILCAEDHGTERLILPLTPGTPTGYLSMVGPAGTLNESDRLVLVQTAGTCAILLGQGRTGGPSAGRQRLVADLLLRRLASEAAALARAQMLGIDTGEPVVVGLVHAGRHAAAQHLIAQALGRAAAENAATVPDGVGVIVQGIAPERAASALRATLEREGTDGIAVALSRPVPTVLQAPDGLRQARFTLALQRAGAIRERVAYAGSIEDLGLFSLLYPLWGSPEVAEFRAALLGPLEAYDRRRHSELIETLEAYFSHGGALAEAAEELGIHRNTLSYRLQRIAELTGRDLSHPRDRLLLQVALLTRHLPPEG